VSILAHKVRRKLLRAAILIPQRIRVRVYRLISWNRPCEDKAQRQQPVLLLGEGKIFLGRCHLGFWPSPYFLNGYIHIEARLPSAEIQIGDGVWINNNAVIIAEHCKISIGKNTLIGTEFTVYDSDFHDLHPERRMTGKAETAPVIIGENIFIGSRVTVLKGTVIGNNSIIASGAVVTGVIPENCIAAGVPAKVVGSVV
jgi:maltose O-acetyltransferase